ncbi:CTAG/Pcc1 family [Kickxella alabastrina]|uniref:CTAG/Pcc1 family n=1 Tax=Kickxella alabastrina TaxID=61397 RepID=UPI00221EF4A3|nr:CTAG/Pcc1 family [Kickxella alabastrina]KAI7831037.1 CTAG/Pcc1 family [Kickxella alabastrina]
MDSTALPHTTTLRVPFPSAHQATIAMNALQVDRDISGDKIHRTIQTEDSALLVTFRSSNLRTLRVTINGFMDSLILVSKTLEAFSN